MKVKSLLTQYFQGEQVYNYGGQIPPILFPDPTPSPTPSPTSTAPATPTPTPSSSAIPLTPTPTPTITSTLSPTPTTSSIPATPTPTRTGTPTPTPTNTPSSTPASFDPDASAYLSAVVSAGGVIDATISAATNTLFTSLKSSGLYGNLYFYPMIGSVKDAIALMGNRTFGTTYDIDFNLPITFDNFGFNGNGAGFGQVLNLNRTIYSSLGDVSWGVYITQNGNATSGYELGTSTTDNMTLITRYVDSFAYVRTGPSFINGPNPSGLGMYVATLTGSSGNIKLIKNGSTTLISGTTTDDDYDTSYQFIGRSQSEFSLKTIGFAVFTNYLNDAQVLALSNIINTFQTSLGRNTY